jgi:hypothetical protein
MTAPTYAFFTQLATTLNSGQARSVILAGHVQDLYFDGQHYVPLIPFLCRKSQTAGILQLVYELNGPIRILKGRQQLRDAWIAWKSGVDPDSLSLALLRGGAGDDAGRRGAEFDQLLLDAIGNPTLALELLRQFTICSRSALPRANLLIFIEAADLLLPAGNGDASTLNDAQLRRISVVHDWFSDPAFMDGADSVCLVAESRSSLQPRIARLPQVVSVEAPPPGLSERLHFVEHFAATAERQPRFWSSATDFATLTAGCSLHALRQLLLAACYADRPLTPSDVINQVEAFIQAQLGEDVVEFKRPAHRLEQVVGFTRLKRFLREELLPRFRACGDKALTGAAVAGPIGGGKTFIFEAVAGELEMPVLVLKNVRSQWFGQTDVIFERLRRLLSALDRVVIFVDEADTQFGSLGAEAHETERRLTGKIQAMMSDPALRGRIFWLLMTARIHRLSPDLRRPGRVGDLIIPVLDPEGEDRRAFVEWLVGGILPHRTPELVDKVDQLTNGYSAAEFSSLRATLKAKEPETLDQVIAIITDQISPAIGATRRYQTLQALVNCTRRSLLPNPSVSDEDRAGWGLELLRLEAQGIS